MNVAGIDIGAFKHAISTPRKDFILDARYIEKLIDTLAEEDITTVVLEPTGIYHIPIIKTLLDHGFQVYMVHSTRFGRFRAGFGKKKGDAEDAQLLRKVAEMGSEYLYPIDEDWVEAKFLGWILLEHSRTTKNYTMEINRLRRDLYLVDPSLAFMTPSSYKEENFEGLDFGDMTFYILSRVKEIDRLRELKKNLEKEIKRRVTNHEDGKILLSIPGISYLTAGLLISAYVNINRYRNLRHFKSMLGYGLNTKLSGESVNVVRASKAHIPIRAALFRVVLSQANKPNKIGEYYREYRRRMPFRKAVLRTSAKIIEWIYYMLKKRLMWED